MRRRLPLLRTVVALSVALVATSLVLLFVARVDRVLVAPGVLVGGTLAVHAPSDGRILAVHATPGAEVAADELLIELDDADLRAEFTRLEQRRLALEDRAAGLYDERTLLRTEAFPAAIEQAERAAAKAELEADAARKRATLLATLERDGLVTKLEAELAELHAQVAQIDAESAREALSQLDSDHRLQLQRLDADRARVDAELREIRAARDDCERRLALTRITAPIDGVVVARRATEIVGTRVTAGEEILRVAHARTDAFEGRLAEDDRARALTGLAVRLRVDGYPWLLHGHVDGTVRAVSERSDDAGGFDVTVAIDTTTAPGPLFEGMRAKARIIVESDVTLGRLLLERLLGPENDR